MKKFINFILCVCMFFSLVQTTSVSAALTITTKTDSIDNIYGFNPRFIATKTTTETHGMTNDPDDRWMQDINGTDIGNWNSETTRITTRITSDSQKGNVWIRYNNVGNYNGNIIDLKLTIEDWDEVRQGYGIVEGKKSYPTIIFYRNMIRIQPQAYCFKGLKYSMKFYKHGTDTPIKVMFHATFLDIDNYEYLTINSNDGIPYAYLAGGTKLTKLTSSVKCDANTGDEVDESDKLYWVTICGNTNEFVFQYRRDQEEKEGQNLGEGRDYSSDLYNFDIPLTSRRFYWWLFSSESVSYFDAPNITEKVTYGGNTGDTAVVKDIGRFYYDIWVEVPKESSEYYYPKFVLSTQLMDGLNLDDVITSVYDNTGKNVKSLFNIAVSSTGKVTYTLKNPSSDSFYDNTYNFRVGCRRISGYDLKPYLSDGDKDDGYAWIPNDSEVDVTGGNASREKVGTEPVYTRFQHEILSSVVNGDITSSKLNVDATSDVTFSYTPNPNCYIQSVKVDGVTRSLTTYGSSFTFKNVEENHTIDVVYEPQCSITERVSSVNEGNEETSAVIFNTDDIYFYIHVKVPEESKNAKFDSFVVEKNFNDVFDNEKFYAYTVKRKNGNVVEDVSDYFTDFFDDETGLVRYRLNSEYNTNDFYGHEYIFKIKIAKKKGYDVSSFVGKYNTTDGNGKYAWVHGRSSVAVERSKNAYSVNSNYTYVRFQHEIISSVVNGTITESKHDIDAATDVTYEYSPNGTALLQSVTVDGVEQDLEQYPSNYQFSNINDNHTIDVVYEPQCVITETVRAIEDEVGGKSAVIFNTDYMIFDISVDVPLEAKNTKFDSFVVEKNFNDVFDQSMLTPLTIKRVSGDLEDNVKEWFTVSVDEEKGIVRYVLKDNYNTDDFYDFDYVFSIKICKKKGYDVSSFVGKYNTSDGDGKYAWVHGRSSVTVDRAKNAYSVNSNNTYVRFQHEIISSVVNGTISESKLDIDAATSVKFSYSPLNKNYILRDIFIDDEKIDALQYPEEYWFNNVNDNHTIDVVYEPKCTIVERVKLPNETTEDTSEVVFNTDEFMYVIHVTIPSELKTDKFSTFVVEKNLRDGIDESNVKVEVLVSGIDVTGMFNVNISQETGLITFEMKERYITSEVFYGEELIFNIITKKKKGYDLSSYVGKYNTNDGDRKYAWVNGRASLSVGRPSNSYSINSNYTYVRFQHEIISSVVNGTITTSKSNIEATTTEIYSYSPKNSEYILQSVKVDGIEQNLEQYSSDYQFSNINDNHKIDVVYMREFDILTSKIGKGSVTESIYGIPEGEDRLVEYHAADGWFTYSVTVDGEEIDLSQYPTEYYFNDIDADHEVIVEFRTLTGLTIVDSIEVDETYWWSGEPTFLYRIEGTDYTNVERMLHVYLKFSTDTPIENNRMTLSKQVTNLPAGNYTVSRVDVSRYYGTIDSVVSGSKISAEVAIVNTIGQSAIVTYHSNRTRYDKFDHNDFSTIKFVR